MYYSFIFEFFFLNSHEYEQFEVRNADKNNIVVK